MADLMYHQMKTYTLMTMLVFTMVITLFPEDRIFAQSKDSAFKEETVEITLPSSYNREVGSLPPALGTKLNILYQPKTVLGSETAPLRLLLSGALLKDYIEKAQCEGLPSVLKLEVKKATAERFKDILTSCDYTFGFITSDFFIADDDDNCEISSTTLKCSKGGPRKFNQVGGSL